MNTNLALLLLLAPFIGFLFNVFFGKASENQLLGSLEPLLFHFFFCFSLFLRTITSNPAESKFHFRLDSNQQFQGRFWFSIRPIIHFMVTVCNRNWFVNSYVLYQLHA
jgi:NADH-quinone oxidoreductase subunit L